MSDERPIEGDDAEPNPESQLPRAARGKATSKAKGMPRADAGEQPEPVQHEDDGEDYDAADDGPVEIHPDLAAALEDDARNRAELAGFTFDPAGA